MVATDTLRGVDVARQSFVAADRALRTAKPTEVTQDTVREANEASYALGLAERFAQVSERINQPNSLPTNIHIRSTAEGERFIPLFTDPEGQTSLVLREDGRLLTATVKDGEHTLGEQLHGQDFYHRAMFHKGNLDRLLTSSPK